MAASSSPTGDLDSAVSGFSLIKGEAKRQLLVADVVVLVTTRTASIILVVTVNDSLDTSYKAQTHNHVQQHNHIQHYISTPQCMEKFNYET